MFDYLKSIQQQREDFIERETMLPHYDKMIKTLIMHFYMHQAYSIQMLTDLAVEGIKENISGCSRDVPFRSLLVKPDSKFKESVAEFYFKEDWKKVRSTLDVIAQEIEEEESHWWDFDYMSHQA